MKKKLAPYLPLLAYTSDIVSRALIWAQVTVAAVLVAYFVFSVAVRGPELVIAEPVGAMIAGVCAATGICSVPVGMTALVLVLMVFAFLLLALMYNPNAYRMDDIRADMDNIIYRLESIERRMEPPTPPARANGRHTPEEARDEHPAI